MRFIDRYIYKPNFALKCLSFALLPISLIYLIIATIRRKVARTRDFGIPIISVGNLVAGGSGKTPFLCEIAQDFSRVAVVSRGYKRKSRGLVIVSQNGKILAMQGDSGDEAFLIAKKLKNATVIVCENRAKGVVCAKNLGAKVVFLDDGFRFKFKKLNIVLTPSLAPFFRFPIPSGIYRENPFAKGDLNLREGVDYTREVRIENASKRMLLLTAIANPARLDAFFPENVVGKIYLRDHAEFDLEAIKREFEAHEATSILITQKDAVKLESCALPKSLLVLKIHIDSRIKRAIKDYVARESRVAQDSR